MNPKFYSQDDLEWLRQNYSNATDSEIRERFPQRSPVAIHCQVSKMKLRKKKSLYKIGKPAQNAFLDLTDVEKAYLAGLFDGEGCVMFRRHARNKNCQPVYSVQVSIGTTSIQLSKWLEARFPGHAHLRLAERNPGKWRDFYNWVISGTNRSVAFLKSILPHLIIKREQAELMIQGYIDLPEADRFTLWQKMRELKRTC